MTRLLICRDVPPPDVFETGCSTGPMNPFSRFGGGVDGSFAPAFEVRELSDRFVLEADLPGVRLGDVAIFISGTLVTIRGRRSATPASEDAAYHTYERTYGAFWRAFRLFPGVTADGATADLRAGVLRLVLPKRARRLNASNTAH